MAVGHGPLRNRFHEAQAPYEAELAKLGRVYGPDVAIRVRRILHLDFDWVPDFADRRALRRQRAAYRRTLTVVEGGEEVRTGELAYLEEMVAFYSQCLATMPRGGRRLLPPEIARMTPGEFAARARKPGAPWWANPVRWPSFGDKIAELANFLATVIPARRRQRRDPPPQPGRFSRDVLEWTARLIALRYRPYISGLKLSPEQIKARLIKR
jgi:hypothetical protein